MKYFKRLIAPVIIMGLIYLVAYAASPRISGVTDTTAKLADGNRITTIVWIADSTGAVTATTSTEFFRGFIDQYVTKPDTSTRPATADSSGRYPSANYDIVLTTTENLSAHCGALTNRHATATERAIPWLISSAIYGDQDTLLVSLPINGKLIADVTGNIIPDARGKIYIYWREK